MNQVGWEIRPLGWLVVCVVGALLVYLLYIRLQQPPMKPDPER